MRITVAHPAELGPAEIRRWREHQRATPALAHPFLAPEFALAAGRVRARTRVAVLDDGAGFFAFERGPFGLGRPVAPDLNDLHGVVHAPGFTWSPRELLRGSGLALWPFDHLVDGQEPVGSTRHASPVLDLTGGFAAYRERVARRRQAGRAQSVSEIPRKERRITRRVGDLRLDADTADPAVLDALMTWKSAQYRRSGAYDRFARPWIVALLTDLLSRRTDHFACELDALHAGDDLLAAVLSLRCGPVVACWFSSYDPAFGAYSPGMVSMWRSVEAAAARGVTRFGVGRGPEPYKQLLKTGDDWVHEGRFAHRAGVGEAHRLRHDGVERLRRTVVDNPRLYAIAAPVRRQAGLLDGALRRRARTHG